MNQPMGQPNPWTTLDGRRTDDDVVAATGPGRRLRRAGLVAAEFLLVFHHRLTLSFQA